MLKIDIRIFEQSVERDEMFVYSIKWFTPNVSLLEFRFVGASFSVVKMFHSFEIESVAFRFYNYTTECRHRREKMIVDWHRMN